MFSAHPAVPGGFGEAVDVGAQTGICTVANGGIGTEGHEERQPRTVHEVQTIDRHQVADIVKSTQFLAAGYDGICHFLADKMQAKQVTSTDSIEVETLMMQFLQFFKPIVACHSVTVFREGIDVAHIFLEKILPRIFFTGESDRILGSQHGKKRYKTAQPKHHPPPAKRIIWQAADGAVAVYSSGHHRRVRWKKSERRTNVQRYERLRVSTSGRISAHAHGCSPGLLQDSRSAGYG